MESLPSAAARTKLFTPPPLPITLAEDERAGKHLIFRLDAEDFGIRVAKVQEILGIMEITSVPQTPPAVKGVINLRGRVIPVIDLRLCLGLTDHAYTEHTCIIVVRTQTEGIDLLAGVIVDRVSEVLNISAGDIQDTPGFGTSLPSPYLLGLARVEDKVRILLDIEEVFKSRSVLAGQP